MQIGPNFPWGTFGVHVASGALGAHGRLGATPLATNCWPKAPRGGGGGGAGVVGVLGPAESPPPGVQPSDTKAAVRGMRGAHALLSLTYRFHSSRAHAYHIMRRPCTSIGGGLSPFLHVVALSCNLGASWSCMLCVF